MYNYFGVETSMEIDKPCFGKDHLLERDGKPFDMGLLIQAIASTHQKYSTTEELP